MVPAEAKFLLPRVEDLKQPFSEQSRLYAGWHATKGLGFRLEKKTAGKPQGDRLQPETSDGLQVWIDTRNTQTVHRATKFCHHFCFLPTNRSDGGKPYATQLPIARAREEQTMAAPGVLRVTSEIRAEGYTLDCWIPARVLHGYDPANSPRVGFYWRVADRHGEPEFMTVNLDFPVDADPSLWQTLVLSGETA